MLLGYLLCFIPLKNKIRQFLFNVIMLKKTCVLRPSENMRSAGNGLNKNTSVANSGNNTEISKVNRPQFVYNKTFPLMMLIFTTIFSPSER